MRPLDSAGVALLSFLIIGAAGMSVAAADVINFERQIRPLLRARCAECHGSAKQKGGLRLDARHAAFKGGDGGRVIVAGKSDKSELLNRLTTDDPDARMPRNGRALSRNEIELIKRWIDQGAGWPETEYDRQARIDRRLDHWAFQAVRDVKPPHVKGVSGAIDSFVVAKLREHSLTHSPQADRRTLIRRLFLDVIGLPPSVEQVNAFVTSKDPAAWERLVDQALASPRYGERWGQHWLDVVRYADTHGFEVNTPRPNAWPYRDYVIRAFNEDKPYDQFIREQLAGDAFGADDATGFLVAAAVLLPGQIGKDEESKRLARQDELDEIITGTGATMLGLTIGCARCHDHKFDPITQRDYYAMQAFFAGVDYGDRKMVNADRDTMAQAASLKRQIETIDRELRQYEPSAFNGRTILIDEEDKTRVTYLKKPNGPGANPAGTKRGYLKDVGSADRVGNLSRGRYTWWNNTPGEDVITYQPGVAGRFRLWVSWGAHGSGVHTRDARYVIDKDGDLTTRDDQKQIASVDQYCPAGVSTGETEKKPLWSGLLDVGEHDWTESTKLILRGGDTGRGITADVIVLQERASSGQPLLRNAVSAKRNTEQFAPVTAKFIRFTTLATIDNNKHQPCIDELEVYSSGLNARNVALASAGGVPSSSGNYANDGKHQLKHVNDGRYGNERSWISNQYGGGWVQIELAERQNIDRIVWGRDRNTKYKDRLPVRYRIDVSPDGKAWQRVAGHDDRVPMGTPFDAATALLRNLPSTSKTDIPALISKRDSLQAKLAQLETTQVVYGGQFRKPDTTFVLRRGDPEQRTDRINPAVPALFNEAELTSDTAEQDRRLALAEWIASPKNPLTARVMVNRIWLYHFGRGLVNSPSDFGINGERPRHPDLLDWLAGEFVRSGWSVKHIHRLILHSRTYRQSHRGDPRSAKIDRDNRYLWRFASRRLEAETIRDSVLAVSGELNLKMGGPGFDFFKTRGGLNGFPPVDKFGPEHFRRMVYAHKVRMERVPIFGAFDCPDAGQATPRRSRSTTAIQALNLFNSPFMIDRANQFAKRIKTQSPNDVSQQVTSAFEIALGRPPSELELTKSVATVHEHGLSLLCRVLFNTNEFLFMP